MTGLFGSLNIATGGMNAQQNALQTTSHNLSNINTPGYSRQRVTMKTAFPQSRPGVGQMGMGVQVSGVTRVTDDYVTRQLENEMASFVENGNISEVLGQLEAVFNEPSESSVSHQMSEFFAVWGSLSEDPASKEGKKLVVSQSETFVDAINHITNKIDSLAEDTIGQIKKDVLDFNSAAKQLNKVNEQIFHAKSKGEEPNDLMDTQDQLIGQLKSVADVAIEKDLYGRVSVSFGKDKPIVSNEGVKEIAVSRDGNIYHDVTVGKDGYVDTEIEPLTKITMKRGSIKGFQKAHADVQKKGQELNDFVENFTETVNTIMKRDSENNEENSDALKFFTKNKKTGELEINEELLKDPSKLVTGEKFKDGVSGNGSRAKAIADLQNVSLKFDNKNELQNEFNSGSLSLVSKENGSKLFDSYNGIITDMGIIKQQADNTMDNQADLVSLLDQRKESISGVDMNEEVVNMIQQQSAFQANARMITTINEMLDTLINRTGV